MGTLRDSDIGQLVRARNMISFLLQNATPILEGPFPETLQELHKLVMTFDREYEANLLHMYDGPTV
jgi:hypothetical protein